MADKISDDRHYRDQPLSKRDKAWAILITVCFALGFLFAKLHGH